MNDELGVDVDVGGQPAGLPSRTKPQGQDEKGAMAGTKVEPSKKTHGEITLDLSAAAGPAVEERQEDDQEDVGQEDRQEKKEGVGGVFLLEVQYSVLKSLISTCVLSYVGSRLKKKREDWLLDRICESKKDCWDSIRRTSYPYQ